MSTNWIISILLPAADSSYTYLTDHVSDDDELSSWVNSCEAMCKLGLLDVHEYSYEITELGRHVAYCIKQSTTSYELEHLP